MKKILCVVFFALVCTSCATKTAKMSYTKAGGVTVTVTQPAENKEPAKIEIKETGAVVYTAPVSFSPGEKAEAKALIENAEARATATVTEAKAKARVFVGYHLAALALAILGVFALYKQHWWGGFIALGCAPVIVVLGHFGQKETALNIAAFGGGLLIAFVGAWYILKAKGFLRLDVK